MDYLPTEILLMILSHLPLDCPTFIYPIALTCRRFFEILIPRLHKLGAHYISPAALTPFHWAVKNGIITLAASFINHGADVNSIHFSLEPSGELSIITLPLQRAARNGDLAMTKLLLENSANVDGVGYQDLVDELDFQRHGVEGKVNYLIRQPSLLYRCRSGRLPNTTPLHLAVEQGHEELVRLLISWGANVNAPGKNSVRALDHAVCAKNEKLVALLLEKGADVNSGLSRHNDGKTPLYKAVGCGSEECVALLLSAGADMEVVSNSGVTVIHRAVAKGNLRFVKMLVENGADIFLGAGRKRSTYSYQEDASIMPAAVTVKRMYGRGSLTLATNEEQEEIFEYLEGKALSYGNMGE